MRFLLRDGVSTYKQNGGGLLIRGIRPPTASTCSYILLAARRRRLSSFGGGGGGKISSSVGGSGVAMGGGGLGGTCTPTQGLCPPGAPLSILQNLQNSLEDFKFK